MSKGRKNVQSLVPTSRSQGRFSGFAPPATDPSSPWEAEPLAREGFRGRKGRAGLRSRTCGGDGLRTKHLVSGKRMFCKFWLEFPEAEQEMSTGIPGEKPAVVCLPRGPSPHPGPVWNLKWKAPSESWCLFPLFLPPAPFFP